MAAPAGAAGQARLTYTPQPHEQAYYDGLFAAADAHRSGSIGGQDAVKFLSLSGLPVDVLKPVWTLADQPATNALDRQKFYVAVRLIQLLQNGQKGQGPNLAAPEGVVLRPANFQGVSGNRVPLPPAGGQQQPPPQQQQQQQQPNPMSPPRPPHPAQQHRPPPQAAAAAAQSTALTAQDPYTLTPSEQARYEGLFPEYAKPDGYVYGAEAVALFGKSGLPQTQLAAIWNMVDSPVDNRLDKLEFAMAMHLIVCLSKKNLPLPPGLPLSLKQLKAQQQPAAPTSPALSAAPHPQQSLQAPPSPVPSMSSLPSQTNQQQQMQMQPPQMIYQQQQPQMQQPMTMSSSSGPPPIQRAPTGDSGTGLASSMSGPPPLQQSGGIDIHDAFEGLDGAGGGGVAQNMMANPSMSQHHQQAQPHQQQSMGFASMDGSAHQFAATSSGASLPSPSPPPHQPTQIPEPQQQAASARRVPSPAAEIKSTQQLKSSYDMGAANEELVKLKAVLQKLQAENISLKATMGSLTDEEREVQKELNATVAEIGKLSNELTTVRAKVLAAKSRLLEATAELKACHEKKTVFTDLIAEANATKDALDDAYNGIEEANEVARSHPPPAPAPAPASSFDGDFFSFDAAPAPLPQPAAQEAPAAQEHQPSYGAEQPSNDNHGQAEESNAPDAHLAGHHRIESTGSGYAEGEGIMGGAPTPLPSDPGPTFSSIQHQHPAGDASDQVGASPPSMESIATLKEKLKDAEDVARDAEESRRQIAAQTDELRRLADEADAKSRTHLSQPESKKKGFLGRGKHKKDAKEGERLAQDAKAKKDKLLEAQSQLNDAQALAVETKAEAERLRKEAEEAEIKLASANSMQHPQPSQPQPVSSQKTHPPTNGFPPQQASQDPWGAPMAPQGMEQSKPHTVMRDISGNSAFGEPLGGQPGQGAFSAAVMGSGGVSIPDVPSNVAANPGVMASGGMPIPDGSAIVDTDDPYSNPFST